MVPEGRDPALQEPFDVAVLMTTVLEPSLLQAVRSVYAQDFPGRVQILIAVDMPRGDPGLRDIIEQDCPPRMAVSWLDMGYSTSISHGGTARSCYGGYLRSALCFLANAERLIFLDSDNWMAPDHLSRLLQAIDGFDWAYTLRWFVDPVEDRVLCVDDFESAGPGRGIYLSKQGGFVDTNCMMIDRRRCLAALHLWSVPISADGTGQDHSIFKALRAYYSVAWTGRPTLYYWMQADRGANRARYALLEQRNALPQQPPGALNVPVARTQQMVRAYLAAPGPHKCSLRTPGAPLSGWINCNRLPTSPDVMVVDPARPLPLSDNLLDYVAATCLIERLTADQGQRFLGECFRILKPGGKLRLATQDLETAIHQGGEGRAERLNGLFYDQGRRFLYSPETLQKRLFQAGFEALCRVDPGHSDDPELCGVEESLPADGPLLVMEAMKPRSPAIPAAPSA
ncbi:hypothetical protein JCM17960_12670 [Magnetospira thiophila]